MNNLFRFLLLLLLCFHSVSHAALTDGLMAYYPFNGNANDESGNGNNGTVNGASLITNMFGQTNGAYLFNGSSDYIDINLPTINVSTGAKTTVSFWIYWNGNNMSIPFGFNGYDVWLSNGHFGINTDQADIYGIDSNTLVRQWVLITAIFNNGDITQGSLYINNSKPKLIQKDNNPITRFVSTNARIGYYIGGCGSCYFSGKIDDVRIYNRALSATEIEQLYYQYVPPVINGTAPWKTVHTVTCQNVTQNTSLVIPKTKAAAWDCEKAGLVVNHGDKVKVTIDGTKY